MFYTGLVSVPVGELEHKPVQHILLLLANLEKLQPTQEYQLVTDAHQLKIVHGWLWFQEIEQTAAIEGLDSSPFSG